MTPISYVSDQIGDYTTAIHGATTLAHLRDVVAAWKTLCPDAVAVVETMTTKEDFRQWRKGLAKERRGYFAGDEFCNRFGALLMPEVLLKVGMLAAKYCVPWGCAYIRLKETGQLKQFLDAPKPKPPRAGE